MPNHRIAVLGRGNKEGVWHVNPNQPAQVPKKTGCRESQLGGGGPNVITTLGALQFSVPVNQRLNIQGVLITGHHQDPDTVNFIGLLEEELELIRARGSQIQLHYLPLLKVMAEALIFPPSPGDRRKTSLIGDQGDPDTSLLPGAMAELTRMDLPAIRIAAGARLFYAELAKQFLTQGEPKLRVLIFSGTDLISNPDAAQLLLEASDLAFLNEGEARDRQLNGG